MRLAVFDIDGTLTNTNDVDSRCFATAFAEKLGIPNLDTDWSNYPHRTDSGIAAEICGRHLGRPATPEETFAVQQRFMELLTEAAARESGEFEVVPGAKTFLASLPARDWAAALATGGWRVSAALKLESAGVGLGLPLVTSNEAVSRQEIVALAIASAERFYKVDDFERIVSVGDGVWDLEVAMELGLPFVGVAAECDAQQLLAAGASHVLSDFSRPDDAMQALTEAVVPNSGRKEKAEGAR